MPFGPSTLALDWPQGTVDQENDVGQYLGSLVFGDHEMGGESAVTWDFCSVMT